MSAVSYIIAFVSFQGSDGDYPVNCYRTDIYPSEKVMVRLPDRAPRLATVERIEYLNWNCKGRIECKYSEFLEDKKGSVKLPHELPKIVGLATDSATAVHLMSFGWINVNPRSKKYSYTLTNSNETQSACISFRTNGVDLLILAERYKTLPRPFSEVTLSRSEGSRSVHHFLSDTKFNLYEGIVRFAQSFHANENNYEKYFVSVGSRDRASSKVKNRLSDYSDEVRSFRNAFAGTEDGTGRIYLCDGEYL